MYVDDGITAPQITREDMFGLLLAADPSFYPRWDAFLKQWESELELPLYLALDSLADHLLQQLAAKETGRFEAIFEVVERWHVDGDPYVSQAATVGLLESLQNLTGGNSRIGTVEPWLGPESRRSWDELDRFWQGSQSAV